MTPRPARIRSPLRTVRHVRRLRCPALDRRLCARWEAKATCVGTAPPIPSPSRTAPSPGYAHPSWNYEFFAAGVAQSSVQLVTDSINWGGANGVPVYVAIHRPLWTGVSHRIRNHSVTDKTPSFQMDSIRTWNGNTVANDTASFQGTMWSVAIQGLAYDSTVNVVFIHPQVTAPVPDLRSVPPLGDVDLPANGPSTRTGSVTRHIVVTYNGTSTATLQVIGTTTLTCNLNLITGNLSDCTGGGTT